ncbi:MAG: hypothetical protein ACFE0Q_06955 [Anaerolineae bacterium]
MKYETFFRRTLMLSLVLSALTLLGYALLGLQTRMIADDYCTAAQGLTYGVVEGTIQQYKTWGGQYTNFFLKYTLAPLQPAIHSVLPALTIALWMLALAYLLNTLKQALRLPITQWHLLAANIVLTYTFYRLMPSYQHALWFSAVIPYVWSLIALLVLLASAVHYFSAPRPVSVTLAFMFGSAVLTLLIGGFVEVLSTMLIVVCGLLFVVIPVIPRERRTTFGAYLLVTLSASGVALGIGLSSPGSALRRAEIIALTGADNLSMLEAIPDGILYTLAYIFGEPLGITFGQTYAIAFLASMFLFLFGWGLFYLADHPNITLPAPPQIGWTFLFSVILGGGAIFAVIYPAVYAASGVLPMRPLIVPRLIQWMLIVFWVYLALVLAQRHHLFRVLPRARTWPLVVGFCALLVIWSPMVSLYKVAQLYPDYARYAHDWDARHALLSDAPDEQTAVILPLSYDIEDNLVLEKAEDDTNFWINRCMANFYDLPAVRVTYEYDVSG